MAGIEESQFRVFDLDGERVNVPVRKAAEFTAANPGAQELRRYRAPGADEDFWVRDGQTPPEGAERVYRFRSDEGVVNVRRSKLGGYIGERASAAQKANDARLAEQARKPRPRAGGDNRGNALGRAVSAAGDVLGRVPANLEALGDRIVAGPVLLAGRVADAVNPDPLAGPVDVLTGKRGRFSPQEMGYDEDPYKQGPASRAADKARAWLARRDEARAPKTAAGRVADVPIGFAAQLGGYATPAGPLMMVGNAAQAGDRAYAEGASGSAALGRTAASLGAQALAFGPKPLPVPGANAAGRAVEGAAARIGGRLATTPEGAARAVRTAVTAGQVARGAVESGARMAGVTAAEGGSAKDVAIAAGVGGVVGGAARGFATRPLARAAGEAASRMVGAPPPAPGRGGVETPPRAVPPAPGGASSPSEPAPSGASAELAAPARAGLPPPAEPGAVPTVYGQRTITPPYYGPTISRPGEPITPPAPYAEQVPPPIPETREAVEQRRREAIDAMPLPKRLKRTSLSFYQDQYPDRAGVLDAIGYDKFVKLSRKYKGDFRNVTGDLVDAAEIAGITGRDEFRGADGVRLALEAAQQELDGFRDWKTRGAPTAEEEMQTGQEVAYAKGVNAEAEAETRRRYELTHPEMTGEPPPTPADLDARDAAAEEGEIARIEAEARAEEEPVAGSTTPPQDFALDGGTPAEIDAEKARAAEAQKRAALEEQAAAPGKDLGTVTIQDGLPGLGGDGTLFTPPAGGWTGRRVAAPVGRGPGLAHPEPVVPEGASASASPGPGPAPAPAPAGGEEDPHADLKRRAMEARVRYDAGDATKEELRAVADELEGRSLYATAAVVRSKIGEYAGFVQGTERGARDYEAHYGISPGAPGYGALAQVARELGKGRLPEVARRLARRNAVGLFTSVDGMPDSGAVAVRTDRFGLLDAEQREAVRRAAEERGVDFHELLREAIQKQAAAGPVRAAQVLAHEIGHWLDFLPEGTLKRGNILGHVAGLFKYLKRSIYGSASDAAAYGGPALTAEEVRARAKEMTPPRESFPPGKSGQIEWLKAVGRNEKQARADLIAERRMATRPELKRQMEDLVAWYGQSDGADPYYADSPKELLAEAFSAWVWAPEVAAEKAPEFVRLLEGWAPANKAEAWKALDRLRGRDSLARKAEAAAEGRDPFDPAFAEDFKAQRNANTQAFILARKFEDSIRPKLSWRERGRVEKARMLGRFEPIRALAEDARRSIGGAEGQEQRDEVIAAINTFLRADSWVELYERRMQRVLADAAKAGISPDELDLFLTARRMAHELLGKDLERGAMNLPGPGGMTPGDVTRRGINEETSAAAYLHHLEDNLPPEQWAALNKAADDIYRLRWEEPNSPGRMLEESGALKPSVLAELKANRDYWKFLPVHSFDEMRELSKGKTSVWPGVYRRSVGSHDEGVSGIVATALGDATILRNAAANIARRDIGTFLARVYPQYVKPAETKFRAFTDGRPGGYNEVVQRTDRHGDTATLVWSENGDEVGIDVPSWIVKPLLAREPVRPELPENRVMRGLAWLSQSTSQALTTYSYLFNLANAGFRDWLEVTRMLPSPEGASPLRRLARDIFGRPFAAARDVWGGGHGKARQKGLPDEALDAHLNTLPPDISTAYKLGHDVLDSIVEAFGGAEGGKGLRPELVVDALRRFGGQPLVDAVQRQNDRDGRINRALRTFLRGAWDLYNRPLRWMQRIETNEKINVRERLDREQPSWSDAQKDDWTIRNAGTPRPDDRPLFLDKLPFPSGILPFYTINAHGLWDQTVRASKDDPVGQALQFLNHATWRFLVRHSWPWLVAGGAITAWLRREAEPDENDTPDDAAAKRRLSQIADAAEDWGEMQRSVSERGSRSHFTVPLGWINKDRKTVWGIRHAYDQSLRPVDAAFDWILSEIFYRTGTTPYRETTGKDALSEAVGGMAPSAGWIPRAVSILFGGVDVGDNFRTVDKEADDLIAAGASRARALADVLTGRLFGQFSFQGAAPRRPGDEKEGLEKLLERPGLSVLKAVLFAGDGGRRELAAKMRKDNERIQRLAQEGLKAQWEGKEPTPEQEEAMELLSNPGQAERDFERRADERAGMSADEWQLSRAGRERGEWLDERYRITPPPPIPPEDRAR